MASPYSSSAIFVNFLIFIRLVMSFNIGGDSCEVNKINTIVGNIVGVFHENSRVGKEMKIASEMAVNDFHLSTGCKYKAVLITKYVNGGSDQLSSSVIDFTNNQQVNSIIWTVYPPTKLIPTVPTISILPFATSASPQLELFQLSSQLSTATQCIAAIVGHFRWRKVTVIYESSSDTTPLGTILADSLEQVNSVIERIYRVDSVESVEGVLKKLRSKGNRVFVLLRSSLEFGKAVFMKATEMEMMEKGFVWIVSEDIASMVESLDTQFVGANMQGVIGFKTFYSDTTQEYIRFRRRFRARYGQSYPEEEEYSNPSLFALRAYDATMVIAKSMKKLLWKNDSRELTRIISSSKVKSLSGDIIFKNGQLSNSPTFRIINVVGRSYREIAYWSPSLGFLEDLAGKTGTLTESLSELGTIYWPGGLTRVPKGQSLGSVEKPLKVGVPARGAFKQFIKVIYDEEKNGTYVSGFSVDVFEAAVRHLPYQLYYELVPFYGSYDDMIDAVLKKDSETCFGYSTINFWLRRSSLCSPVLTTNKALYDVENKILDAGLGDTQIMADRYENVEFSQPYLESGLVMVVLVRKDKTKELWMFMKAFKLEMWLIIPFMHLLTSLVVWFIENREKNPQFKKTPSQNPGDVLWFSFTLFFFAQRETVKSNLSRTILAIWVSVIVLVAACYIAVLTSMVTVSRLQPSVINIEYLKNTNAVIGCNMNSFIAKYLINVLHFKPKNVREINLISDYPNAFQSGQISAAFFVKPHAKVFVSKYCNEYTMTEPSYTLGGLGIAFPRGSPLVTDISEAILKLTQSGEIQEMEKQMLSSSNCKSLTDPSDNTSLGLWPFSGLFIISGAISTIVFLVKLASLQEWNFPDINEIIIWAIQILSRRPVRTEIENFSSQANTAQNPTSIELASHHDTAITHVQEEN